MKDIKKLAINLLVVGLYLAVLNYSYIYVDLLKYLMPSMPLWFKVVMVLLLEFLLVFTILFIYRKSLIEDFKDLKENHKNYFKNCLKYYLIGLGIMYISNFIIVIIFDNAMPANEESIREMFNVSPIYIFLSAVVIAPINEELVFRKAFRNLINNKWLYIIISGLVFGSLHVFLSIEKTYELLFIIPYTSLGIAFAYMYYKVKNIFIPISFHLIHNGILIALQFLVMILL